MKESFGIYIGKDLEVITTDQFMISFRRIHEIGYLESSLSKKDNINAKYQCVAICRSTPLLSKSNSRPKHWRYAYSGEKKVYSNDNGLKSMIGSPIYELNHIGSEYNFKFWDTHSYTAVEDEQFQMEEINPRSINISPNNIGQCLVDWQLGCHVSTEIASNDQFLKVEINTTGHMYYFSMCPDSFYCRAARFAACNNGIAFKQNFRQRKSQNPETYMSEDNRVAMQPLTYDVSEFLNLACPVINPADIINNNLTERQRDVILHRYDMNGQVKSTQAETGKILNLSRSTIAKIERVALDIMYQNLPQSGDSNIYWTLASFSENQIILNGCQGDVYEWSKPNN